MLVFVFSLLQFCTVAKASPTNLRFNCEGLAYYPKQFLPCSFEMQEHWKLLFIVGNIYFGICICY